MEKSGLKELFIHSVSTHQQSALFGVVTAVSMLDFDPLLWGFRSQGPTAGRGRPQMLGLGFTHRESVSGGVLGRSCSQHPGSLSSSAPRCPSGSHTAPCFSVIRICGGGKAGPQVRVGAGSKVVNEHRPPAAPASCEPTHITAGRLQLPLTSWRR